MTDIISMTLKYHDENFIIYEMLNGSFIEVSFNSEGEITSIYSVSESFDNLFKELEEEEIINYTERLATADYRSIYLKDKRM